MVRWHLAFRTIARASALALVSCLALGEEPAHYTFVPAPPGTIIQSRLVYLAGESMHSQWRGVLSKKRVGAGGGNIYYQWYLSIYAINDATYQLKYQSPDELVPFDEVEKAHGASLWFPVQDGTIVGAGEFMGPGAQQLVVQSHEAAADCGTARVDVFFFDAAMQMVMTTLSVENGCNLQAKIVHEKTGDALRLTGPYYAANAALCCPTNPKATSLLHFHNGTWTQQPVYFKIVSR
jgi:hypothetical protein